MKKIQIYKNAKTELQKIKHFDNETSFLVQTKSISS